MQKPAVIFQPQTTSSLQEGINQIVNAIKPTLGPFPRLVAYDTGTGIEFLDDGGSIARRIIQLPDRDADMGAMYVRQLLWRIREHVGDGAATAAVLFQTIYNEGIRMIAAGGNGMRLRHYLEEGLQLILAELDKQVLPIEGKEQLAGLAETICHDPEMAHLLGEIFDIIGEHGHFELRNGRRHKLEREYVEGMYWAGGLVSRTLLTDPTQTRISLENCAILISDLELTERNDLGYILQLAVEAKYKEIVLLVKSISDDMLGLLLSDHVKNKIKVLPVKFKTIDQAQIRVALQDLAVLTGGRPVIREAGQTAFGVTTADFGSARRGWADLSYFGLSGGKGDPRQLRQHISELRRAYDKCDDPEIGKELQTRIGKLMGGTAILSICGATESELKTRKTVAERTARVLRGAVTHGVLPGGGAALLACRAAIHPLLQHEEYEARAVYQILDKALQAPLHTLVENAGDEPAVYLSQIEHAPIGTTFDIRSKQLAHAQTAGILDVTAVQKEAVERAIRSAALALTIDVMVHVKNPKFSPEP